MTSPVELALDRTRTRAAFTIFHPKGNIVTAEMVAALTQALEPLAHDEHLKLITIEGAGADFSFGASVPEHAPGQIERVLPEMHALIYAWLAIPVPTAAIVRGRCLGGGFELALACDFIFAEASATFGLPEIALGVFPPAASALLPARIGTARATRAILSGTPRLATDWQATGLIEEIARDGEVAVAVDRWFAANLQPRSAAALRHATEAARLSLVRHVHAVLPDLERLYLADLMNTHDAAEGIAAFLEKRQPRWTDR
jgi:cyclohexa-1,5-dienecarbonyl-CoA hydratase